MTWRFLLYAAGLVAVAAICLVWDVTTTIDVQGRAAPHVIPETVAIVCPSGTPAP